MCASRCAEASRNPRRTRSRAGERDRRRCSSVRMGLEPGQHSPSHLDERRGATRRHVEAPEQLLAWCLDGLLKAGEVLRRGACKPGPGGAVDVFRFGRKSRREEVEERRPPCLRQLLALGKNFARDRGAGHLAALGKKRLAEGHGLARLAPGPSGGLARLDEIAKDALEEGTGCHGLRTSQRPCVPRRRAGPPRRHGFWRCRPGI